MAPVQAPSGSIQPWEIAHRGTLKLSSTWKSCGGLSWAVAVPGKLYLISQELFNRVDLKHCLGFILCAKNEYNKFRSLTVQAVVTQFNHIRNAVIITCLEVLTCTLEERLPTWSTGSRWPRCVIVP